VACHFPVTVQELPDAIRESKQRADVGPQGTDEQQVVDIVPEATAAADTHIPH
jgi:hypothetical protein